MKQKLLSIFAVAAIFVACTTSQQRKTYNSIATVQATAQAAVDGYYLLVIQHKLPTNNVPQVSHAFNAFQDSVLLATQVAENNTNALAPGNLILESQSLFNLINTIEGKH